MIAETMIFARYLKAAEQILPSASWVGQIALPPIDAAALFFGTWPTLSSVIVWLELPAMLSLRESAPRTQTLRGMMDQYGYRTVIIIIIFIYHCHMLIVCIITCCLARISVVDFGKSRIHLAMCELSGLSMYMMNQLPRLPRYV